MNSITEALLEYTTESLQHSTTSTYSPRGSTTYSLRGSTTYSLRRSTTFSLRRSTTYSLRGSTTEAVLDSTTESLLEPTTTAVLDFTKRTAVMATTKERILQTMRSSIGSTHAPDQLDSNHKFCNEFTAPHIEFTPLEVSGRIHLLSYRCDNGYVNKIGPDSGRIICVESKDSSDLEFPEPIPTCTLHEGIPIGIGVGIPLMILIIILSVLLGRERKRLQSANNQRQPVRRNSPRSFGQLSRIREDSEDPEEEEYEDPDAYRIPMSTLDLTGDSLSGADGDGDPYLEQLPNNSPPSPGSPDSARSNPNRVGRTLSTFRPISITTENPLHRGEANVDDPHPRQSESGATSTHAYYNNTCDINDDSE